MTEPLRCACCGETRSAVGFVRVEEPRVDGVRLVRPEDALPRDIRVGDMLRAECAQNLGFRLRDEVWPPGRRFLVSF